MSITSYATSPRFDNRVSLTACGQGQSDQLRQFNVSTYTSGVQDQIGFCIRATLTNTPIDQYDTTASQMTLWLNNLTCNIPFTLSCPVSLTLTSPYTSINGSLKNKVFINTTSAYTIPDTHQGNYLISNTTATTPSITLPLITASDNGYSLTIKNMNTSLITTLLCQGTNLISTIKFTSATPSYQLIMNILEINPSVQLLAFTNGAISYWLVI